MNELKETKISKCDFFKIKEEDVMFITNPGRMGDEDGSTFVVRNGNEFTIYRIDGWMYPNPEEKEPITLEDTAKQFPKWYEAWNHADDNTYQGKYHHIYMGFGNGLNVDHSIYPEFEPFLDQQVEAFLKKENSKDLTKDHIKYIVVYTCWEDALISFVQSKNYILK